MNGSNFHNHVKLKPLSLADSDLELKEGRGGGGLLALPGFLPSVFFLPKIKEWGEGEGGRDGPLP